MVFGLFTIHLTVDCTCSSKLNDLQTKLFKLASPGEVASKMHKWPYECLLSSERAYNKTLHSWLWWLLTHRHKAFVESLPQLCDYRESSLENRAVDSVALGI